MNNLFIAYTPFQLYIAQEIIKQEKLKSSILVYSYSLNRKDFPIIFDFILDAACWADSIEMDGINNIFCINYKKPISSAIAVYKKYYVFYKLVRKNNIKDIYVGEVNNLSLRIIALLFSRHNININFFEEGSSHYHIIPCRGSLFHQPAIGAMYSFIFDVLFFNPLFHLPLGKSIFLKGVDFSELPINRRYSILNYYHETYDQRLLCAETLPTKIINHISKEIKDICADNCILFLSQPIYEVVVDDKSVYYDTIKEFICIEGNNDTTYIIKFHPKETAGVRNAICRIFSSANMKYKVIGNDINLPVEFYLKTIHFAKVVHFFSSTCLYNGLLFPKTCFISLLDNYYRKCMKSRLRYAYLLEKTINSEEYAKANT